MKRIIFAILFVSLLIGLASLIPNSPSNAYPPSTPVPPDYIGPTWFGIYCDYLGSGVGYIRVKWDHDSFPAGWELDQNDPGTLTIYYPSSGYTYRPLLIVENGVTKIWGTTWYPHQNESADISGYVHLKQVGGSGYGSYTIYPPSHTYQYCPEPLIYLPFLGK